MVKREISQGVIEYTFQDFEYRCREIAEEIKNQNSEIENIYGIPRGGLVAATRISHLTGLAMTQIPDKNKTAIIDDCIDSGRTRKEYKDFRWFYVLINKQKQGIREWVNFWWEKR